MKVFGLFLFDFNTQCNVSQFIIAVPTGCVLGGLCRLSSRHNSYTRKEWRCRPTFQWNPTAITLICLKRKLPLLTKLLNNTILFSLCLVPLLWPRKHQWKSRVFSWDFNVVCLSGISQCCNIYKNYEVWMKNHSELYGLGQQVSWARSGPSAEGSIYSFREWVKHQSPSFSARWSL